MIPVIWIVWAAWVLWHYFVVPADPFALRDGAIVPAPYWREAALRATLAVAGASLVTLSGWAAGALALRRLRPPFADRYERILFELAAGLAILSLTFLALATVGLYRPATVFVITIAGVCAAAWLIRRPRKAEVERASIPPFSTEEILFVSLAGLAVALGVFAALAPETEYDALWYHLWLPRQWLEAGRPVDLVHEYPSLYPQTWELLFGAAMTIGGPVAARLMHLICLPLVGFTTARLAALVLPARRAAIAAGVLAIVSPTMIWEATTAYIDLALAWYVVLSVYALVRYAATNHSSWLLLSAAMIGVGMAIKHLGLVAFAILGLAVALLETCRRRFSSALRACVAFAFVAVLPASPYYARAYIASGNPVFPDLYQVFGAAPRERWDELTERGLRTFKTRFGRERTVSNLLTLPWDATIHAARYGGSAGPLFLLLVPLGLLAGPAVRWILIACGLYVLVWASPISSFQFRFLVPILPLLAVAAAGGLTRLPRIATVIVLPLLLLNLPPFTEWHERDKHGWAGWLTHVQRALPARVVLGAESQRTYLARTVPSYAAWEFANARLARNARVLTFFGGDHLYSERARLWSNAVAARPATWDWDAGSEANARAALKELGITHVLMDRRQLLDPNVTRLAIASDEMRRCCLELLYEDARSLLYRVR